MRGPGSPSSGAHSKFEALPVFAPFAHFPLCLLLACTSSLVRQGFVQALVSSLFPLCALESSGHASVALWLRDFEPCLYAAHSDSPRTQRRSCVGSHLLLAWDREKEALPQAKACKGPCYNVRLSWELETIVLMNMAELIPGCVSR